MSESVIVANSAIGVRGFGVPGGRGCATGFIVLVAAGR